MKVLITGADGFVGKNLQLHLAERKDVQVLTQALLELMGKPDHTVNVIGTRHGEKLYEALLGREEMACAEDRGDYFRVPPDARDLNYAKFVDQGEQRIARGEHATAED